MWQLRRRPYNFERYKGARLIYHIKSNIILIVDSKNGRVSGLHVRFFASEPRCSYFVEGPKLVPYRKGPLLGVLHTGHASDGSRSQLRLRAQAKRCHECPTNGCISGAELRFPSIPTPKISKVCDPLATSDSPWWPAKHLLAPCLGCKFARRVESPTSHWPDWGTYLTPWGGRSWFKNTGWVMESWVKGNWPCTGSWSLNTWNRKQIQPDCLQAWNVLRCAHAWCTYVFVYVDIQQFHPRFILSRFVSLSHSHEDILKYHSFWAWCSKSDPSQARGEIHVS